MQGRPSLGLPSEIRPRNGADTDTVTREQMPFAELKGDEAQRVARNVKSLEFVPSHRKDLAIPDGLVWDRCREYVHGMDGIVGMEVVGSASLGCQGRPPADVIGVAVGVDHFLDGETLTAGQLQIGWRCRRASITIARPSLATT